MDNLLKGLIYSNDSIIKDIIDNICDRDEKIIYENKEDYVMIIIDLLNNYKGKFIDKGSIDTYGKYNTSKVYNFFCKYGNVENLEYLLSLDNNYDDLYYSIIENERFDLFEKFYDEKKLKNNHIISILINGNYKFIVFLYEKDKIDHYIHNDHITDDLSAMDLVIKSGNFSSVYFLHTCRYLFTNKSFLLAIKTNNIKIVKFLYDNNCREDENSIFLLISIYKYCNNEELIKFLYEKYPKINRKYICENACNYGNVGLVKFLCNKNNFIMSELLNNSIYSIIEYKHYDMLKYLLDGIELDRIDYCKDYMIRNCKDIELITILYDKFKDYFHSKEFNKYKYEDINSKVENFLRGKGCNI